MVRNFISVIVLAALSGTFFGLQFWLWDKAKRVLEPGWAVVYHTLGSIAVGGILLAAWLVPQYALQKRPLPAPSLAALSAGGLGAIAVLFLIYAFGRAQRYEAETQSRSLFVLAVLLTSAAPLVTWVIDTWPPPPFRPLRESEWLVILGIGLTVAGIVCVTLASIVSSTSPSPPNAP